MDYRQHLSHLHPVEIYFHNKLQMKHGDLFQAAQPRYWIVLPFIKTESGLQQALLFLWAMANWKLPFLQFARMLTA